MIEIMSKITAVIKRNPVEEAHKVPIVSMTKGTITIGLLVGVISSD